MNAYLAEVLKKQEEAAKLRVSRDIALNCLNEGMGTVEQIAKATGLSIAEVMSLTEKS